MIALSPERVRELVDVLAEAFTPDDIDRKLAKPLGVPTFEVSNARETKERALALVMWASHQDRLKDLLSAALQGNPSSIRLRRINEAHGLIPATSAIAEVMREVLPPGGAADWLRGLADTQRQVCRIRVDAHSVVFTGFLVGPDQVMTYTPAMGGKLDDDGGGRGDVELAFEGVTLGLDRKRPIVVAVPAGALVLRLDRAIARETAQADVQIAVRTRGWIAPQSAPSRSNGPVVIVQAAEAGVTVAADVTGNLGSDGTTIRYRTTTHLGSIGSPCFDESWRFLGMHVGGSVQPDANHGRAVEAIVRELLASGFGWDISRGVHQIEKAKPAERAQSLDHLVRGIAHDVTSLDDAWIDEVEDLELPVEERWAWAEAAAVHAGFDPERLRPWGPASEEARVALLLESRRIGDRWVLSDRLRKRALQRLTARGELAEARDANPTDATDAADVMLGELIAGRTPKLSDPRDPNALRSLLMVVDWLEGTVEPLPNRDELRATLERATLLAPFRDLTRGFFAGREAQLARLAAYAAGDGNLPLFIHGPGGMGKSALLAHFVLAHSNLDPTWPSEWRPFIYLDFDRAELDATDQLGVILAVVRQLGPQVPAIEADAQGLVDRWSLRKRSDARRERRPNHRVRQSLAQQIAPQEVTKVLAELIRLLQRSTSGTPIVLILDTLEEVQFATPDAIEPLIELCEHLRKGVPALRPIFAGRIAADAAVELLDLPPLARSAAEALLGNELPPDLAAKPDLVARLAEIVGGNPLSLRLAAEFLRREAKNATAAIEKLGEELRQRVSDAIVQGRLYERLLGHIHEARVSKIAYPGLVLRRISWELIRDVLAVPCELGVLTELDARKLFDSLAKEVALVRKGQSGDDLELRPELRRIVREDFANDAKSTNKRLAIHRAAVEFYAKRTTPADRAEEIYHRLALGEDPSMVDKRWLSGIEPLLRGAVGELPAPGAAYLANRVGGVTDAKQIETAAPIEWEEWAGRRAGDLLKLGQPAKALELLATRTERLPASKLHYVESIARHMLPVPDLAGAEAAAERAVRAARSSSHSEDLRDALEELVRVRRLRGDRAGVLRALADLGNFGDALGDDLVLLQSEVEGLESVPFSERREQFTYDAVRVFNRLPDELVAKAPELSRRVAAQVGGADPATLQRVIRTVGTGSIDEAAAAQLRNVLTEWKDTSPDIASFVPDADKSPHEIASAAQYLVSTRELDSGTASKLAAWLGSVVTPKASL